mmetsp:Transcript_27437/g.56220  ORF Transcript_27437/g.56220 Transcript_27437/m.56220 type:complete len:206 (-) Transcript_27437:373-990(-)|eukprot:CAMPEP_0181312190 /NCGR_PEP_ID=MMETSP1101-20121128/13558_1 /TAXON_ID=46948 /ORGANISM="Rhodomonas abbreviata, Strain Caron Lab Isolate" /LENGTH=205 /DNA_ID=CAMNT_0023419011 /DNA_START=66 /DNA_END=683 /DNA_ORIENTATION=+
MALIHQETWVRNGTNGIGLSDHQNRYSNGVCIANWVENEYGDFLSATSPQVRDFDAKTTVQVDYIQRQPDPDNSRVPRIANSSQVDMAHGPDNTHDLTLMTTTYDLSHCHAEGPRRVDTVLWSGVTKIDRNVPTAVHSKSSLLEKKKAEWAAARESTWQTAYGKQYTKYDGVARETRGVVASKEGDYNFSRDKRPHIDMGLRGYP